jgi:hypothetical protein
MQSFAGLHSKINLTSKVVICLNTTQADLWSIATYNDKEYDQSQTKQDKKEA